MFYVSVWCYELAFEQSVVFATATTYSFNFRPGKHFRASLVPDQHRQQVFLLGTSIPTTSTRKCNRVFILSYLDRLGRCEWHWQRVGCPRGMRHCASHAGSTHTGSQGGQGDPQNHHRQSCLAGHSCWRSSCGNNEFCSARSCIKNRQCRQQWQRRRQWRLRSSVVTWSVTLRGVECHRKW
jgi:hypothetical protein